VATNDKCVTIVPYFKVPSGKMDAFKQLAERFVKTSEPEPKTLFYGWSFCEDVAFCREGYADAEGALAHLEDVWSLLGEAGKIAELARLEIHGAEPELAKLRGPLAQKGLKPQLFTLEYGFRR
jgi:hypothetical protein